MESNYRKRTQKNYPMSLKLQIVQEVESGTLSQKAAKHKYGIQRDATIRVWLKNMVTLTGRIKYQHPCQKHQNKG